MIPFLSQKSTFEFSNRGNTAPEHPVRLGTSDLNQGEHGGGVGGVKLLYVTFPK